MLNHYYEKLHHRFINRIQEKRIVKTSLTITQDTEGSELLEFCICRVQLINYMGGACSSGVWLINYKGVACSPEGVADLLNPGGFIPPIL